MCGSGRRFIQLSKRLKKMGVRMDAIEVYPSYSRWLETGYTTHEIKGLRHDRDNEYFLLFDNLLLLLKAIVKSITLCCNEKYDLVISHTNNLFNLIPGYVTNLLFNKCFVVISHHYDVMKTNGAIVNNLSGIYGLLRKMGYSRVMAIIRALGVSIDVRLMRKADFHIAVSELTADVITKLGYSRKKIFVNGNGVDLSYIDLIEPGDQKKYDAAFVGRISKTKGVSDLIEAWKLIVTEDKEAKLVIIGSGPYSNKIKNLIKKSGLDKNITLKERVSDYELYSTLKASKLFVFPSIAEGWGLAVAEAMACHLPVVCYRIPALKEVFDNCPGLFFVDVGDAKMLALTVGELLKNEELCKNLGQISREYVERFNWWEVAEKEFHILKDMVNQSAITTHN